MNNTLLFFNTIMLIFVLACSLSLFIKIFLFKDIEEKVDTQVKDLKSDNKNLMSKIDNFSNCFFDISEHIENKMIQIFNHLSGKPLKTYNDKPLLLNDFSILYFTPYDGYLSVEAEYCELNLPDDSQICIKNKLKDFYISANRAISIKNIKNLKDILFLKKAK